MLAIAMAYASSIQAFEGCTVEEPNPQIARALRSNTAPPVNVKALRLAIEDIIKTNPGQYARGPEFLKRLDACEKRLQDSQNSQATPAGRNKVNKSATDPELAHELRLLQWQALIENPALDFDRLLIVKRNAGALGLPQNWQSNSSLKRSGFDNEIAIFSPFRPNEGIATLCKPDGGRFVGDVDLHFDGDRMLFSSLDARSRWQVFEIKLDGSGLRQVTPGDQPDVDAYDACYLPNGKILFSSTAQFTGVPCVFGGSHVSMIYSMDADGKGIRQLCFEQDHDWCPVPLNNGRVLYARWEYADTPHSQTRFLFHMNPDGTEQMEYYGSNSYWPNSIFYARAIPGHPTKVVAVISGHHGVPRMGELVIFDPAQGRNEANGAVQRIPGFGQKVEPIIKDQLVNASWPKFLHPYPLSEKYFLVACQPTAQSLWGIYLVDVFDNMLMLREEPKYALLEPIPVRPTPKPPVIPDKVDLSRKDALIYVQDIYAGPGLKGVPRGSVKKLRVFTYHFAYQGMGGLIGVLGMDGPWDIKRIMGTVPVEEDGSCYFRVPANTPVAVQPLDAEGKAMQLMRSWMTAMPGETLSCAGCHERQNSAPSGRRPQALASAPAEITPWLWPTRGFSYPREVQPVLDKYCISCHNGESRPDGKTIPSLRGDKMITDFASTMPGTGGKRGGKFSVSYAELHRYVRRPGIESDYHLLTPLEFHADTTELVRMLRKGHHGVQLDAEAWNRLITWIDLNTEYHGTWTDAGCDPGPQRERRRELQKLYANRDEDPEREATWKPAVLMAQGPEVGDQGSGVGGQGSGVGGQGSGVRGQGLAAVNPQSAIVNRQSSIVNSQSAIVNRQSSIVNLQSAIRNPQSAIITTRSLDLGGGVTLELALIPAGEFIMGASDGCPDERPVTRVTISEPFWMGRCEVSNAQFARFDPTHDSRVESKHAYQFGIHGYPMNKPDQPVVRVSWRQVMDFCEWFSQKTGESIDLPTEAQWEYACRAGATTPFWYGDLDADFSKLANLGDARLKELAGNPYTVDTPLPKPTKYDDWVPKETRFDDGALISAAIGSYRPNPWGLCDMHGNVAELTRTTYAPYPYNAGDGREAGGMKLDAGGIKLDAGAKGQGSGVAEGRKVVRGGSWYDRPMFARASYRLDYPSWQCVYNVGFRIISRTKTDSVPTSRIAKAH
ncbi:MAG: SUMF1/EgtB/PvdO family nonheme iron enzyme [Candidatus Sumerlaeota bacterium]|nr:SUMF1/EgtB/PvdO family nonheme iron enzyme [Candidatus Sumerlaeota bacterium]